MEIKNRNTIEETYDAVVVGAGHAGCEAALSLARRGFETILFTVSVESIALMPCNPNIGGSSKGHLVREVDALGGQMGKNIDATFIQSKMLNKSKGPAVHSLRAQADKSAYSMRMRQTLEETDLRCRLPCQNRDSVHGRLSESPLHLRGCLFIYGPERAYGCEQSVRFFGKMRHFPRSFQDGHARAH